MTMKLNGSSRIKLSLTAKCNDIIYKDKKLGFYLTNEVL